MSKHITDIGVSRNKDEEQQLQAKGFSKMVASLTQDSFGNAVYLWSQTKKQPGDMTITRLQYSFNEDMARGLKHVGYKECIEIPTAEGPVSVWFFRGNTPFDMPIVEMALSSEPEEEAEIMKHGFESVGCNLSDVTVNRMYLWVKREKPTYICDVTATNSYDKDVDLFNDGYNRFDETTNTIFCGKRSNNFLWYRQTIDPKSAITDLKISTNHDEYEQYQQQGYTLINVNLNSGTGGRAVYLWYKKEDGKPVKSMVLLLHKHAIQIYKKAGIQVTEKNINEGNCGEERFLSFLEK